MKATDFWRKEADKMRNTSNITDTKAVTDTSHLSPEREELSEEEKGIYTGHYYTIDGEYLGEMVFLTSYPNDIQSVKVVNMTLEEYKKWIQKDNKNPSANATIQDIIQHYQNKLIPKEEFVRSIKPLKFPLVSKEYTVNHEEFLYRANWIFGESGQDTQYHKMYAHTIQNAMYLGRICTGETQYKDFEDTRSVLMQDKINGQVVVLTWERYFETNSQAKEFNDFRNKPQERKWYHKTAIAAVVESIIRPDLDPAPTYKYKNEKGETIYTGWGYNSWVSGHKFDYYGRGFYGSKLNRNERMYQY